MYDFIICWKSAIFVSEIAFIAFGVFTKTSWQPAAPVEFIGE